jgi:hypothetical protein
MKEEVVDYNVDGIGTSDNFVGNEDFINMKKYKFCDVEKALEPSNGLRGKYNSFGSHLPFFKNCHGGRVLQSPTYVVNSFM